MIQCRYLRRNDALCTAEAVDPEPGAHIYLCSKHVARVMRLLADQGFGLTPPPSSRTLTTASKES